MMSNRLRIRTYHARRTMVRRVTLPATELLFWHCAAHTAKSKIGAWTPIPICCLLWARGAMQCSG